MARLLNVHQAAEQLGLRDKTIRNWIALRRIEFVKVGAAVRIRQSEIDRIVRSGTVPRVGATDPNWSVQTGVHGGRCAEESR